MQMNWIKFLLYCVVHDNLEIKIFLLYDYQQSIKFDWFYNSRSSKTLISKEYFHSQAHPLTKPVSFLKFAEEFGTRMLYNLLVHVQDLLAYASWQVILSYLQTH